MPGVVCRTSVGLACSVEQADGFAVTVRAESVDAKLAVIREILQPADVVGVDDERGDVRVIPGGGVQVVDRALAQVQVLLEGGSARRDAGVMEVAEDRGRGPMGRYSPCVGQFSCPRTPGTGQ